MNKSPLARQLEMELHSLASQRLSRQLDDSKPLAVDFCSNDTLGLSRHPQVVEAATAALLEYGAGARASRLLRGGSNYHEALEQEAAGWLQCEAALLFPSGYHANLAVVQALTDTRDVLFSDRLNHASLIDACRLSRAGTCIYPHRDRSQLEQQLKRHRSARRRIILTESIFSMDGDAADLEALLELAERFEAQVVVDEAHAVGLLGPEGGGELTRLRAAATSPALLARVVTGGKALGVSGALVAASKLVIDTLINRARTFAFTTAPPAATAAALRAAIRVLRDSPLLRETAANNARELAARLGLAPPAAAIVPYIIGNNNAALQIAAACRARDLDVRAVRPPTVPNGTARLRLVAHAFNTQEQLIRLCGVLQQARPIPPPTVKTRVGMPPLFVAGTDTGIGKTVISAVLVSAARQHGAVRYFKPVQTGDDDDTSTVAELTGAKNTELLEPLYRLPLPASPHEAAAAAGHSIEPAKIEEAIHKYGEIHPADQLVVELAGGLLVPYTLDYTQADLLRAVGGKLILVARSGLGTLNHTLLTFEAIRARNLVVEALFLVGKEHASNCATLRRMTGIPHVFELEDLAEVTAEALASWRQRQELAVCFHNSKR